MRRTVVPLVFIAAILIASMMDAYAAPFSDTEKVSAASLSEELVYEAEFSKLLLRGIQVAEFRFTSRREESGKNANEHSPALVFIGDVASRGFFRKLFGINFRYRAESIVDPTSLSVRRNKTLDEQGKRARAAESVFDLEGRLLTWTERDLNDPARAPRVVSAPLEAGPVQDLLTAVYFLRSRPLAPGATFDLQLSDSGRIYRVPVSIHSERKKMKSVVGRVAVVRVELGMFGEGRPLEGDGRVTLWVTDDARRLPLRAKISSDVGTLDIALKSVGAAPRA